VAVRAYVGTSAIWPPASAEVSTVKSPFSPVLRAERTMRSSAPSLITAA
jgi:hypothetical protein